MLRAHHGEESFGEGDLVEQAYVNVTGSRYPVGLGAPENRKRVIYKEIRSEEWGAVQQEVVRIIQ